MPWRCLDAGPPQHPEEGAGCGCVQRHVARPQGRARKPRTRRLDLRPESAEPGRFRAPTPRGGQPQENAPGRLLQPARLMQCAGGVPSAQPTSPEVAPERIRKRLQLLIPRCLGVLASHPDRIGHAAAGAAIKAGGRDDNNIGIVPDRNVVAQQNVSERAVFAAGGIRQSPRSRDTRPASRHSSRLMRSSDWARDRTQSGRCGRTAPAGPARRRSRVPSAA